MELTVERSKHELKAEIGAARHELKTEIGTARDELGTEIDTLRDGQRTEIAALCVEFRDRHIALIKGLAGVAIVQTASTVFGTVGLMRLLG